MATIEFASRRDACAKPAFDASTNAGLWLERYFPKVGAKGGIAQTIEAVTGTVKISEEYKRHYERWERELKQKEQAGQAKIAIAKVQGRMVVGLGAESILETAITLHRTYGVPFIPGSALKGLASAAAHRFLANDEWRKKTKTQIQGPSHEILFGNTKTAGFVTFHDALLIPEQGDDKIPLDLDVMTVHHREYYGPGKAPPADWDSPNPVSFVTARGSYLIALEGLEEWVLAAMDILAEALREDGIGAKTAAGYGRLVVTGHQTPEERAKAEAVQKKRLEEEQQARKKTIDNLKKGLNLGNAKDRVPVMLANSTENERIVLAKQIIGELKRNSLKGKPEQSWVQELFNAAGEPLP